MDQGKVVPQGQTALLLKSSGNLDKLLKLSGPWGPYV